MVQSTDRSLFLLVLSSPQIMITAISSCLDSGVVPMSGARSTSFIRLLLEQVLSRRLQSRFNVTLICT